MALSESRHVQENDSRNSMKIIEKYRQAIQQIMQDLHKQACAN